MISRFLIKSLFVSLFILLTGNALAQKVQIGGGLSVNNTFFHRGSSDYPPEYVSGGISPGIGAFIPVVFRFTESWHLKTGLGFHSKQYRVFMNDPGKKNLEGEYFLNARFNSPEFPLLITFRTPSKKNFKFEYSLGIVSSWYLPAHSAVGHNFTDNDSISHGIFLLPGKGEQTYSPDIYGGVTLIQMKDGSRRQEFTLSYQYGLNGTTRHELYAYDVKGGSTQGVYVIMRPTLSCFKVSYAFYPRWLNWGDTEE